jgi:hypothetical protein
MGHLLGQIGQDYQGVDTSGADAVRELGAGA